MMYSAHRIVIVVSILTLVACGGQQVVEPELGAGPAGADQSTASRPKPPVVKRQAKDLFNEAMSNYRPGGGKALAKKTLRLLKDAVDEDPSFGAAYLNIGRIFEAMGDLDKAADYYQQAFAKGKNFADGIANYGRILMIRGETGQARAQFEKALQIDEYNAEALLNLAQDDRLRKDFDTARKRIRKALKGNEKNPKAYAVLARVYYDMGRDDLVKLVCITGLKIDPDYADLNNTLGLVHLKKDDVRSALIAFEAAAKSDPSYVPARLNIGAITFNYRDYEKSLGHFDAVVAMHPKHKVGLLSRAAALRGLERYDEAARGYKDVLTIEGTHPGAHFNLGVLYQEYLSKPDLAMTHFDAVLAAERQDAAMRRDVTNRIKAIRIEIQNKKEVEAMMRQQKAEEAQPEPPSK
ncbi:MAG: tetratricopeptide repeat protein [Myxococcota bacterium]|nr:tetratricopeptide repeat protein [Myxococcota bacterium]